MFELLGPVVGTRGLTEARPTSIIDNPGSSDFRPPGYHPARNVQILTRPSLSRGLLLSAVKSEGISSQTDDDRPTG